MCRMKRLAAGTKDRIPHTMLLHHTEELDNNLRAWPDEDLALSSLLGIVDGLKRII